jgi:hypothetical protein
MVTGTHTDAVAAEILDKFVQMFVLCGACKNPETDMKVKTKVRGSVFYAWAGGLTSGSGWVAVAPLDRGDQCGSNGTSHNVAVAVLAEFDLQVFFFKKKYIIRCFWCLSAL